MILAAGLTPAWQQTLVFDHFRWGEVNRAAAAQWSASGKVFNAGVAAHLLGGPSLTLATVGGPVQAEIEHDFQAVGAPFRWVCTEAGTRVCTTILDRATGTMTELVENGRPVTTAERDAFRRAYAEEAGRAEVVVLTGSLPAGTPESFYRELLSLSRCPAVLDFRGAGLLGCLDLHPYVVKPNREELARTLGRPLESEADLLAGMRSLNACGAQWVVITQGSRPLWVASAERAYRLHPPPAQQVVNPLGCGDSLAAGIAWGTRAGSDIVEAVRLGMAAAAANLETLIPCRFDPAGITLRAEAIEVEEVA